MMSKNKTIMLFLLAVAILLAVAWGIYTRKNQTANSNPEPSDQTLGIFYIEPDGEVTVSNWNGAVTLDAIRFVYRDDLAEPATPPIPMPPPPFPSPTVKQKP